MFTQIKFNLKFVSVLIFSIAFLIVSLFINTTVSATDIALSSQNFVTWNQGGIIGYDAGFTLSGATFNQTSSVVIQLYSGSTLLQTNTAINGKLTGSQFLTPFDVSGTFDYVKDGYFTNKRESEYGKIMAPTKVVATVIIDGNVLTVTNSNLDGQGSTSGSVLGTTKFEFTQKMKLSSQGNEVMELQKFLNALGYTLTADGKFGPKTKGAVIKFQIANSLLGDGIVGPLTRVFLNK